ncbi:hypothetical protein NHE_0129 [Neorickettsia helminthoeca str. Oregon]|uniref:Uncharacterized protein n=1 Tax=Neorickettsia helminthoeca str. Oregon TaxID=1286528 RepID=X5H336_9RICK|nr:hypothetical protein [Neorickettsia helminthoeca]AHX11098.1 hypothetical protein NHE_0129 [Neorickettsia helminthoeca str. Oregon]
MLGSISGLKSEMILKVGSDVTVKDLTGPDSMYMDGVVTLLLASIGARAKGKATFCVVNHASFVRARLWPEKLNDLQSRNNFLNSVVAAARTELLIKKSHTAQTTVVETGLPDNGHWQTFITFRDPEQSERIYTLVLNSSPSRFTVEKALEAYVLFIQDGVYLQCDSYSCGVFAVEAAKHFTYNPRNVAEALAHKKENLLGAEELSILAPDLERIINKSGVELQNTLNAIREEHSRDISKHKCLLECDYTHSFCENVMDAYDALESGVGLPDEEILKRLRLSRKAVCIWIPVCTAVLCLNIAAFAFFLNRAVHDYATVDAVSRGLLFTATVASAVVIAASIAGLIYMFTELETKAKNQITDPKLQGVVTGQESKIAP